MLGAVCGVLVLPFRNLLWEERVGRDTERCDMVLVVFVALNKSNICGVAPFS